MEKEIRIGMVGCGNMASRHLRAYRKVRGAKVLAVVGRNEFSLQSICSQFNIQYGFLNLNDLLSRNDLDAIDVVTPTFTHEEIVTACFASGRHVLCEKPISLNLEQADRMLEAQRKAEKIFMIGFPLRFTPEFIYAKKLIEQKKVGEVKVAWYRQGKGLPQQPWYLDTTKSGGVTAELAIHGIDWLRWMIGSEVESVVAEGIKDIYHLGKEDNAWALYRFSNGAVGVIGSSYSYNFIEQDIGIIGDRLSLKFRRGRVILDDYRKKKPVHRVAIRDYLSGLFIPFAMVRDSALIAELQHFVDCIKENRSPESSGEEARKTLEVVIATVQAMETGGRIALLESQVQISPGDHTNGLE